MSEFPIDKRNKSLYFIEKCNIVNWHCFFETIEMILLCNLYNDLEELQLLVTKNFLYVYSIFRINHRDILPILSPSSHSSTCFLNFSTAGFSFSFLRVSIQTFHSNPASENGIIRRLLLFISSNIKSIVKEMPFP